VSEKEVPFVEPHLLDLYRELRNVTVPAEKLQTGPVAPEIMENWESGIPMLYGHPPQIEVESFFEVLAEISGILKQYHPDRSEDVDRILAALPAEAEARSKAVAGVLRRDGEWLSDFVSEQDLPEEMVGFMVSLTLRPFLRHFSAQLRESLGLESWRKRFCPVCGGHANFSRLSRENGARTLYCSLCETEWPFARIACAFCNEKDQKKFRFFTVDETERYRVNVCESCKGYIKTIDEGKTPIDEKIELFWEDVKTVHLDLLAMREGYENKIAEIPVYGEEVKN
jgi:FdhE protein